SLNVGHEDLAGTGITLGGRVEVSTANERFLATVAQTFADVKPGDILVYEDSYRALSIAINRGDAAATLHLPRDGEVRIAPR
ncbi:MAG TPA: SAM hydroxide adenosyltransferase, partial [Thermoleophilaceae bacterium]|nr:SAM hydroxide adenosyltransferase [Thermoleophilaceae bacterium]